MNKFIRNNFLAICITLSVVFAFAKKATIFQQDKPQTPQNVVVAVNQETNAVFQKYWKTQGIENIKFILTQDSLTIHFKGLWKRPTQRCNSLTFF
jgi:hypothetical protein